MTSLEATGAEGRPVPLREAADYLGIKDVRTLRRELARRGLPILRLGRRICVRSGDIRELERLALSYEIGSSLGDTHVLVGRRAKVEAAAMSTNPKRRRQRRKETLATNLYREHRTRCQAAGSIHACDCPILWREQVVDGLRREHSAGCNQWKTARMRGVLSSCDCPFSCDIAGGPDPVKPTKRIYATTHSQAKREYRERQVERARVSRIVKVNGLAPTSVSEMFERYVGTFESPKTRATYLCSFRKHHEAALGHLNIDDLKYADALLQSHVRTMLPACIASQAARHTHNPQYFARNWTPIGGLLLFAAEERDWPPDAVPIPRLPRVPKVDPTTGDELMRSRTKVDVLCISDVRRVYEWLRTSGTYPNGERYADAVATAFLFSLRHGETRGLQLRCIDLENLQFTLFDQLDEYGNRRAWKYQKDDEPASWKMSEPAVEILARVVANHPTPDDPDALLFFESDPNKPYYKDRLWKAFTTAQRALGITRKDGLKPATFHGLRHSGITYVAEMGASLPELMEYARHEAARTTDTYLHGLNRVRRGAERITKF